MRRRTYLTTATATGLGLSIAGCLGDDGDGPGGEDESGPGDGTDDDGHDDDGHDDDSGDEPDDHEEPDLVGTFDDFEDLDHWEVVVGSLDADGSHAYEGTQSARLTATESEDQVRIVRTLDEPIDLTKVHPGLALSTTRPANVMIQLHDADGDNLRFQQHVHTDHPFVRQNFGHLGVSGDPDRSAITEIQISHWTGDGEAELWVDDLHFVPRVTPGRVQIQFQGGFESDYTLGFPVLADHGLTASTFVATDRIRSSESASGDRLSEGQLAELANAGWTVGTVGANHQQLHEVDPDDYEATILGPLEWFDEHGYDDARYFGFPGGRYDPEAYDLVTANYDLGWSGRHTSHGWASNEYTLTRISGEVGRRNMTAEDMIDALDWTATHGGITTIVFYRMDEDDAEALDEVAAHLASLASAGDLEPISPPEIADQFVR